MKNSLDSLKYRINFVSNEGLLLMSTEWIEERSKIVFLADCINTKLKSVRASIETKGTAYVDTKNLRIENSATHQMF
jgi:hypothetical protein